MFEKLLFAHSTVHPHEDIEEEDDDEECAHHRVPLAPLVVPVLCLYRILEMKIPPVSFISPPHAPAPRSRRYPRGLGPGPFR